MHVVVSKGLDLHIGAVPDMRIAETRQATGAAVLGSDFPGVKFDILTEPGAWIRAGDPVLRDRHRPEVVFTAPASGRIAAVRRGARRALQSIRFTIDDTAEPVRFDIPAAMDKDKTRALMLRSGLWTALRKRPFGHIPDPTAEPRALLVTAIDTEPLAPDPACIIAEFADHFVSGLSALSLICDDPVFLCQAAGAGIPVADTDPVKIVEFSGPHPAGLAGTHIHALCPIGLNGGEVWHIGYQDVISLGHLVNEGTPWLQRIVSFAGTGVEHPRLLRVPVCTAIGEVTAGEFTDDTVRIISGSVLSGYQAIGAEAYLGQRHNQITALLETPALKPHWWDRQGYSTRPVDYPGALIPTTDMERLSPPGILAVPMLRALLVGDVDRARDLGALELIEEDLALLAYACPSASQYGRLLRDVLDQLCKEAA